MFSLSSRGGPTCAACPLCIPECLATSLYHMELGYTVAEDGPKPENETGGFPQEGAGCDPLAKLVLPVQAGPYALLGG